MLLEHQTTDEVGNRGGNAATFINDDGTPGTWLHVIPEPDRRKAFAYRAGIGFAVAFALWLLQYTNGVLDLPHGWFGIVPISIGLALGFRAYRKSTVRQFSTVHVRNTELQRFKRARRWWYWAIAAASLIWWLQPEGAQFTDYWWYAWPALPFVVVGLGLYLRKGDAVLTPAATKAKAHYDSLQQARRSASADVFFESPFLRYPLAALSLYGAYYFGTVSGYKHSGWGAAAAIMLAAMLARELSIWLLFIALFGGIAWAAIAGISALPTSAAIVIGALIIASAIKK